MIKLVFNLPGPKAGFILIELMLFQINFWNKYGLQNEMGSYIGKIYNLEQVLLDKCTCSKLLQVIK